MTRLHGTAEERFWRYIQPEPITGCWLWTGWRLKRPTHRYGGFFVGSRKRGTYKQKLAHVFSYEFYVGPVPEDCELDHFVCDTPECANFDHVKPVTHIQNLRRGRGGWNWAAKTHCPRGHEYTKENTALTTKGSRACRACRPIQSQR